jgi:hypothetical protein
MLQRLPLLPLDALHCCLDAFPHRSRPRLGFLNCALCSFNQGFGLTLGALHDLIGALASLVEGLFCFAAQLLKVAARSGVELLGALADIPPKLPTALGGEQECQHRSNHPTDDRTNEESLGVGMLTLAHRLLQQLLHHTRTSCSS